MPWWLWILFGLGLFLAEMVLPSDFFLFFFGLAAVLVGVALGLGLEGPSWLPWLLFGVLAVAALLALRRPLRERLSRPGPARTGDGLVGEIARLTEELRPGDVGKAELRGSVWSVRSPETRPLAAGRRVRVERIEGLTLWVTPEESPR
jgi:membrane protein implicated in regulation of membrane protease activity